MINIGNFDLLKFTPHMSNIANCIHRDRDRMRVGFGQDKNHQSSFFPLITNLDTTLKLFTLFYHHYISYSLQTTVYYTVPILYWE